MKRLGGPELKLSKPSVPGPVADVYRDLRDRRLLPLVGLIAVAIVAVPFLLGSDSEPVEGFPAAREAARSLESAAADAPALTVVESRPGLRDYRKRLRGRSPDNPFKQHHASASLDGAKFQSGGESGSGSDPGPSSTTIVSGGEPPDGAGSGGAPSGGGGGGGSEGTVTIPPAGSGGGSGSGPGSPGGEGGGEGAPKRTRERLVFSDWAINVRVRRIADGERSEPQVRERVLPQTALPGGKVPVVTYMGAAREGGKVNGRALLLISDQVREVASDGRCVSGKGVCQLLEVTPGFPVVLTYGEKEARYVVNVNRLYPAVVDRD